LQFRGDTYFLYHPGETTKQCSRVSHFFRKSTLVNVNWKQYRTTYVGH